MFQDIVSYMQKTLSERTEHIRQHESCIEIGGIGSQEFRGLIAHFLKTTMPRRKTAILCHYCGNGRCSNPHHLYWGTESENAKDAIRHGTHSSCLMRAGLIERKLTAKSYEGFRRGGKNGGKGHAAIRKLSQEELERYRQVFESIDTSRWGWLQEASNILNVSHTHARRVFDRLGLEGRRKNGSRGQIRTDNDSGL